jgi:hypothetical protein
MNGHNRINHLACLGKKEDDIQVLVDLLRLAVLLQEMTQHAHSTDPQDLLGHARVAGTASLTRTHVTTLKVVSMRISSSAISAATFAFSLSTYPYMSSSTCLCE